MDICQKLNIPSEEFRLVLGSTKIDYDINKDEINRKKHHYSLESAVHLLERALLPTSTPRAHFVTESFLEKGDVRHMHLTLDDADNVVVMVTTMRADETVRVISFRRASDAEREQFASLCKQLIKDFGLLS